MEKLTKLSIQWFYNLLAKGECDILDFKEQLDDKLAFGRTIKSYSPKYEELARDVVAFANKKGGFLFVGITDKSKDVNPEFVYDDVRIFELIRQIQDRTVPAITLKPHKLTVNSQDVLVLEVPFSTQLHSTTRGEYLIRNNDGNRSIEPHEIATILAEKGILVFDQKTWDIQLVEKEVDKLGNPVPGWQNINKTRELFELIRSVNPYNPLLKNSSTEFCEALGLTKEDNGIVKPTTTGVLFIGNERAQKEIPFNQIKYIRYFRDGSYKPYEYKGNLIEITEKCFNQLKSEIEVKEFHFGLFREYIEDYPEVVIRELLVNAVAHRDYSRHQIIEIRKYPNYFEIESPGQFPQGIDSLNYLRKTNPRNPNIMDVFREIKFAEKAGSGFDKIFTTLLSKGKKLPIPQETETSVIFRIEADIIAEKMVELSMEYKRITGSDIDMERLLVLNSIYQEKKVSFAELESAPFVNKWQLKSILNDLLSLGFVETTGKTSGLKYIIHKSKLTSTEEKIGYALSKRQEKARQKEAILRYLDEVSEINNEQARKLLNLPDTNVSLVSRLFSELLKSDEIEIVSEKGHNRRVYRRKEIDV